MNNFYNYSCTFLLYTNLMAHHFSISRLHLKLTPQMTHNGRVSSFLDFCLTIKLPNGSLWTASEKHHWKMHSKTNSPNASICFQNNRNGKATVRKLKTFNHSTQPGCFAPLSGSCENNSCTHVFRLTNTGSLVSL